MIFDFQLTAI